MPTLTCPNCGATLTVSVSAPSKLVCPRCLSPLANPSTTEQDRPLPLMPLEYESRLDRTGSSAAVIVTTIVLAFGAFALFKSGQPAAVPLFIFGWLPLAIGAALYFSWRQTPATTGNQLHEVPQDRSGTAEFGGPNYAWDGGRVVLLFVAGLFIGPLLSLGGCAVGGNWLGFAVPAVAALLAFVPGCRAFAAGGLTSIGCCILIVMSICGNVFK